MYYNFIYILIQFAYNQLEVGGDYRRQSFSHFHTIEAFFTNTHTLKNKNCYPLFMSLSSTKEWTYRTLSKSGSMGSSICHRGKPFGSDATCKMLLEKQLYECDKCLSQFKRIQNTMYAEIGRRCPETITDLYNYSYRF